MAAPGQLSDSMSLKADTSSGLSTSTSTSRGRGISMSNIGRYVRTPTSMLSVDPRKESVCLLLYFSISLFTLYCWRLV